MKKDVKRAAEALRQSGWIIWQSPPPGHHWELVDGRYRAVPDKKVDAS